MFEPLNVFLFNIDTAMIKGLNFNGNVTKDNFHLKIQRTPDMIIDF